MSAINSALGGLLAAQTRLNVSASNTSNARSTYGEDNNGQAVNKPYQAMRVMEKTMATGDVLPVISVETPPTVPTYDPSNPVANQEGIVNTPNVYYERETVNQQTAATAYEANLKVLKIANEMEGTLLDTNE